MKHERFDVVHTHSTKAGLLRRLAARWTGVPVVLFTAHGWAFTEGRGLWKRRALAWVERLAAHFTNKIICVSEYDRQLALRYKVARPDRLTVIHNGIEPQSFLRANSSDLRQQLGISQEVVLTFVGRLAPPKDLFTLLSAWRDLSNCKLLIVGGGPQRAEIEYFVAEQGLADRVLLLGARSDIADILALSECSCRAGRASP